MRYVCYLVVLLIDAKLFIVDEHIVELCFVARASHLLVVYNNSTTILLKISVIFCDPKVHVDSGLIGVSTNSGRPIVAVILIPV